MLLLGAPGCVHADNAMTPIAPEDLKQAEKAYDIRDIAPQPSPGADVTLLPNQNSVDLTARLQQVGPLPSAVREVSRTLLWRSGSGDVRHVNSGRDRAEARWYPPIQSRSVDVQVEATITVEPAGAREGRRETIQFARRHQFVTPVSSLLLIGGRIDGYDMGYYPDPSDPEIARKFQLDSHWYETHPDRYQIPNYFHRIDGTMKRLKISKHLTLGHFTIDFPWGSLGMPQYIALDPNLVTKLEDLIRLIQADGRFPVTGLTPIYGFRPPSYNLGTIEEFPDTNLKVPFSMHQFGRALDFIIDENGDLEMDDLNGDGVVDMRDAAEVMHYVNILDRQYREEGRWEMVGGAGLYDRHDFRGRVQTPYIHVDTRGFQRDNATLIRWPGKWPDGTPILYGEM
jgi:hypothetical protein